MSNYEFLLAKCCQLLDEYDGEILPEYFLDKICGNIKDLNEFDKQFISEIFYGCCDKLNILNVVVNGYYLQDNVIALKSERNYYKIIAFAAIYLLPKYGIERFKILCQSWNDAKILNFLRSFINERNLVTWIKDAWCSYLEVGHVEKVLLEPLLSNLVILNQFINDIDQSIYNSLHKSKPKVLITNPKPFNLTQISPRPILLPQPVSYYP
jgi:hypothetical protein